MSSQKFLRVEEGRTRVNISVMREELYLLLLALKLDGGHEPRNARNKGQGNGFYPKPLEKKKSIPAFNFFSS
jgi:hypothetical protein